MWFLTPCTRRGRRNRSVAKHIDRETKGRKRCCRRRCTSSRDKRTLERTGKQNPFESVGEIHNEWTAAGLSASATTSNHVCKTWASSAAVLMVRHSWTRDGVRSVWAGVKTKTAGLLLIGPNLSALIIFHVLWKSRSQNVEEERRGTESTLLECEVFSQWCFGGAMSSAGVGPTSTRPSSTDWTTPCHAALLQYFRQKKPPLGIECCTCSYLWVDVYRIFLIGINSQIWCWI